MMPIGVCARCAQEIMVPRDVVVWAEDAMYHRRCHDAQLEIEIAEQVSIRQGTPRVDVESMLPRQNQSPPLDVAEPVVAAGETAA